MENQPHNNLHPLDSSTLSSVLDAAVHGIIVVDATCKVVTWNQWIELHSGIIQSEAIGKPLLTLFPSLQGKRINLAIENALQHGNAAILSQALNRDPLPLHSTQDNKVPIKQTIFIKPIDTANNTRLCVLQIQDVTSSIKREQLLRDIATETERAKKEAEKLTQVKSEFISTVSHELRTPLTSLLGSLGLVCGGAVGELPAQASSLISLAHKNGHTLLMLINDLLDVDKIESGNMEFTLQELEVMSIIEDAISNYGGFATAHNVNFKITERLDNITVKADGLRLMQVMSNLLSNAAKFSPKKSNIEISATLANNKVRISVRDHGAGIPEDFLPKLFEKFTQSDSSDTRKVGGTGLGLSISKAIIEQHGGRIGVKSQLGKGTTFYVELPKLESF